MAQIIEKELHPVVHLPTMIEIEGEVKRGESSL